MQVTKTSYVCVIVPEKPSLSSLSLSSHSWLYPTQWSGLGGAIVFNVANSMPTVSHLWSDEVYLKA